VKLSLEDYVSAIQDYNKTIESNPRNQDAYYVRAALKKALGDYRGAIQDYNILIELDPNIASNYFRRGMNKIKIGNKDGGCLDLSKAGELGYGDAYEVIKKLCN
jgi:tetratricopeptide (TPR) repeat protein